MAQAALLRRYLQAQPSLVRVTTLGPGAHDGALQLGLFCDSDWGRVCENKAVDRLPRGRFGWHGADHLDADAELRGMSRACRIFVHDRTVSDFGLEVETPRIWSDSSTGITAAKRIGPGSKLRHLDVSEFCVQGAVQPGKAKLRKVKSTANTANYLTKHLPGYGRPHAGSGRHRQGDTFGEACAGKPAKSVEAGVSMQALAVVRTQTAPVRHCSQQIAQAED